jgi:hypothetical protein
MREGAFFDGAGGFFDVVGEANELYLDAVFVEDGAPFVDG